MDDLESIRTQVRELGRRKWPGLAISAGVPQSTLAKFAYGHVKTPSYRTVAAIKTALLDIPLESSP